MKSNTAARWAGYVAVAIAFAIACAYLSHWQFSRNHDRSVQLQLVDRNYNAQPVPLNDVVAADGRFTTSDTWHPVTITGTYLTDHTILARNRAHAGSNAFEVLVPLRAEDGRILIVDRGWLPPGNRADYPDIIPAPPKGTVTVVSRLVPGEPLPPSGRSAPAHQVPTINLPLVADLLHEEDLPRSEVIVSAYGQLASETPAASTAPQALETPSADPGPFLSYAVQWILFAVMGFVFIWYIIRTERRRRNEPDDDEDEDEEQSEGPSPHRPGRRRDRDADVEDALVAAMDAPRASR